MNQQPAPPEGNRDLNTREVAQGIARLIDEALPQGWGFFLMTFPFNDAPGRMNYVANAKREDVLKLMNEFIQKEEKKHGFGQHVADEHRWLELPKKDVEFLIWVLGFMERQCMIDPECSPPQRDEISKRCHEIWPKLSESL